MRAVFFEGKDRPITIKLVVDQIYPLEQVAVAMQRMEQGDQFGKIVLQITK